ncbi:MAG: ATP-binding cassette domain-containing protein [Spirochaetales bacterium]|nr:ATP-binding cassette domain-containing protein [Spirochaetales bacterium]
MSLKISGISKSFPPGGVKACDDVSLQLKCGTITAIVGENGAGKSTLMNILCGTVTPDSGHFSTESAPVVPGRPAGSAEAGIGMVHQHPMRSSSLTVLENVILGYEPRTGIFLTDRAEARKKVMAIQEEYGIELDLKSPCSELNSLQIQNMELLHLLYMNRKILIFDEPTASLTEMGAEHLFARLKRLREEGKTIIFISHKLKEVFQICDEIAVMRKGKILIHKAADELKPEEVAALMMGRREDINFPERKRPEGRKHGKRLYRLQGVGYRKSESRFLRNINLNIGEGEILGITGIRENGLELLEDIMAGMVHPHEGKLHFNGRDVSRSGPAELRRMGISYVPADRLNRGISRDSSIAENLILLNYKRMHKMGILIPSSIKKWTKEIQSTYSIDGEPQQPIRHLSGGNIQKVILSRELEEKPDLIIISEPSWGLDFNSRNRLHRELDRTAGRGTAILLISSDIDEILSLSDRIAVLYNGAIVLEKERTDLNRTQIGRAMLGLETGR